MIGMKLTMQEARSLIRSGGNFTLGRVDLPIEGGQARPVTFAPPYRLEDGLDYAFHVPAGGGDPELWEVDQIEGGWTWSRRARRSGEVVAEMATRH
jgi:hypothetical protein